jgi:hypothetical protein
MVPSLGVAPSRPSQRRLDEAIVRERMETGGRDEPVGISIETILVIETGHVPSARRLSARRMLKRRTVGRDRDVDHRADATRSSQRSSRRLQRSWARMTMPPAARAPGRTRIEKMTEVEALDRGRRRRGNVMAIDATVIVIEAAVMSRRNRRPRDGHVRARLYGTRIGRIGTVIEIGIERRRVSVSARANGERMARAVELDDTPEAVGRMDIGRGRVGRTTRTSGPTPATTTTVCGTRMANEKRGGRLGPRRSDRECVFLGRV